MNIQDVAEFLDLVKNPTKYEGLLARLVAEQERLKAVIETVGQVSEIEQIRKDILKEEQVAKDSYMTKAAAQESTRNKEVAVHQAKLEALLADQQKYTALLEEQKALLAETKAANKVAKQLEKELTIKVQSITEQQDGVAILKQEYEEKIAKLKSVMN